MDVLDSLFGAGSELSVLQMVDRAVLVFFISLVLIRISGRRSFGMRLPMDNIIVILLGAILSRGVVGASPFIPTIAAATAIVLLHRLLGYIQARYPGISRWIQGRKIILYKDDHFLTKNMRRALTTEEDIREGVRQKLQLDSLDQIDTVYMERNGKISVTKKETETN